MDKVRQYSRQSELPQISKSIAVPRGAGCGKSMFKSPFKQKMATEKREKAKLISTHDNSNDIGKIRFKLLHAQETFTNEQKKAA